MNQILNLFELYKCDEISHHELINNLRKIGLEHAENANLHDVISPLVTKIEFAYREWDPSRAKQLVTGAISLVINKQMLSPKEFQVVSQIINEWDPVGLLEILCPPDEYDNEVSEILEGIMRNPPDIREFANDIERIFSTRFPDGLFQKPFTECIRVAEKIHGELLESENTN